MLESMSAHTQWSYSFYARLIYLYFAANLSARLHVGAASLISNFSKCFLSGEDAMGAERRPFVYALN